MSSKFIGYMAVDYTNPETGEIINGYWAPIPYSEFYKHRADAFTDMLISSSDKALHVLAYLLSLMNTSTNYVTASHTSVAKGMKIARSTVIKCFAELQERDNIRMVQYGLWMINPRLHSKGYETKTIKQIEFYDSLETLADRRLKKKEKETNEDA